MSDLERQSRVVQDAGHRRTSWLQSLVAVPAAVLPLLPCPPCPLCLAAYAGVLSSLGIGFLLNDQVQRPLIVVFLFVTVASVAWATKRHGKFGPVMLVSCGALTIIATRMIWNFQSTVYLGAACVVSGAVWNLILKRSRREAVRMPAESVEPNGARVE